jgi:hypothetical protein
VIKEIIDVDSQKPVLTPDEFLNFSTDSQSTMASRFPVSLQDVPSFSSVQSQTSKVSEILKPLTLRDFRLVNQSDLSGNFLQALPDITLERHKRKGGGVHFRLESSTPYRSRNWDPQTGTVIGHGVSVSGDCFEQVP